MLAGEFADLQVSPFAAAAFWTIARYTREISAARNEVAALDVGLEQHAQQRTEALTRANEEIRRFAYPERWRRWHRLDRQRQG
ncbi:hypothetical protein DK26_01465 [Bosea sp. WAO]|nr:hypothetical protein DK26_01465 [Bosea sp. WAO]